MYRRGSESAGGGPRQVFFLHFSRVPRVCVLSGGSLLAGTPLRLRYVMTACQAGWLSLRTQYFSYWWLVWLYLGCPTHVSLRGFWSILCSSRVFCALVCVCVRSRSCLSVRIFSEVNLAVKRGPIYLRVPMGWVSLGLLIVILICLKLFNKYVLII